MRFVRHEIVHNERSHLKSKSLNLLSASENVRTCSDQHSALSQSHLGACLNERKSGPPPENDFVLPKLPFKAEWTTDELSTYLAGYQAAVLKEHPDKQGVDLVLLEVQETGSVSMTRIQVKLTSPRTGTANWDAGKITDVAANFQKGFVKVDGVDVPKVLATTHVLTEGAQQRCTEEGIVIWDRDFLTQNAWRDEIVEWGRGNGYEEYAPSSMDGSGAATE